MAKTKQEEKTEAEMVRALRENEALKAYPLFEGEKMTQGRWSYRTIEKYLNEKIDRGMGGFTTFQSVWDWEHNVHPVTNDCLWAWMHVYEADDPRHQLAVDIFALRSAHIQSPTSVAA